MNDQRFNQLINKYFTSAISEEEKAALFHEYDRRLKSNAEWNPDVLGDPEVAFSNIYKKINKEIANREPKRWRWPTIAKIAASLLLLTSISLFFYYKPLSTNGIKLAENTHTIQPGSDKAILITDNDEQVLLDDLSDGDIVNQLSAMIKKVDAGTITYQARKSDGGLPKLQYNTIQTPKGGKYKVVLSDGTIVWLNAHSSITFPVSFSGQERAVELHGEAYFEVAKKDIPFIVKVDKHQIRVLGTHFNVQNYSDEIGSKITLIEGSVKVSPELAGTFGGSAILNPGQQAFIDRKMVVRDVDVNEVLAWKNGYFQFVQTDLQTVMRQLSRWYDFDIEYEGKSEYKRSFSGKIKRDIALNHVLEMLGYFEVKFVVEGRTITIKPNK